MFTPNLSVLNLESLIGAVRAAIRPTARLTVLVLTVLLPWPASRPAEAAYPRPLAAHRGMVVSAERDASLVGVEIMREGGNAVDAAVAVSFALAVVHPEAGNLGGGGFMMIHLRNGQNIALDFRETAPSGATRNMYLDQNGKVIPDASTVGYRSVAVPGTVPGMALAEKRFGKIGWKRVIEPARRLALYGAHVSYSTADTLGDRDTRKLLEKFPESRRVFYPGGHAYREGEWMRRPDLAATFSRLEKNGPAEFTTGYTARQIAADMRRHGGLITLKDLQNYRPILRTPVKGEYRGYTIVSMPLPSSGGVALVEMLNVLQHYDLKSMGFGSAAAMHVMIEAMRRAFADRSRFLGDPAFSSAPIAHLLSPSYADELARTISPDLATPLSAIHAGGTSTEGTQTTHFCTADSEGNAVSCTYTLNALFGSGITVPGTDVVLNDEMDDFTSAPGQPNMFGLIQGEANSIAPGKRPLSSMTPTLVLKNGNLVLATGSPGGPTIINTVLEILVNIIDFGMDPEAAVSAPRFHHQWMPDRVRIEPGGFSPDTIAILKTMGYSFDRPRRQGDAQAISFDVTTHTFFGGADPRWSAAAAGY